MNKAWKSLDLNGKGLQSVNLALSRAMRKRHVAYALWLLFPLGAHRAYLGERIGAGVFVALTVSGLLFLALAWPVAAGVTAVAALVLALYDLTWIDRRVTDFNKALRVRLYLQKDTAPPAGYRGRAAELDPEALIADYAREKERERPGHPSKDPSTAAEPSRVPSLQQQEALLRELTRQRRKGTASRP